MVGLYCAVSGCKNNLAKCRNLGQNVTFHRFPTDPSLREIWIESCNRGEGWRKQNVFMCSAHFTPSDFRCLTTDAGQKRTHLVRGAVPSRNLPPSEYVCCAVGCSDAPPEILVRRFPTDVAKRTELLGDVPRKQGISVDDCYLCERHLVLKKFLKDEVEKIAVKKESEEANIVILEVSKIDGKQSTVLIEPPAKRRKIRVQSEEAKSTNDEVKVKENNDSKATQPANPYEPSKSRGDSTHENRPEQLVELEPSLKVTSHVSLASSKIGTDPLPVLVKNGDTSQLMFLHRSPHLISDSLPESDTGLNADISKSSRGRSKTALSDTGPPSSEMPSNVRLTGDLLIDRLYKRIQELDERIVSQRDTYKMKMTRLEDKYASKVRQLTSRVKELKTEVQSFHKIQRNWKKGPSRPGIQSSETHGNWNPSPAASEEVHQILERCFTTNQIKKIINDSEPVRWSHSELLAAYTLKHLSYGAYTFVRNHFKYPLPSPKYLRRWLSKVEKERIPSHYTPDSDTHQNLGSESENESDEELDILVAESVNSENMRGEIILEHRSDTACSSLDFEQEDPEDEGMREEDLHDSREILIVADAGDCSSSNMEISNHGLAPETEFEEYCPLDSSKESLLSPRVYLLKRSNENTPVDGDLVNDASSDCEPKGRSDNDDSDRFEQVLIVGQAEKDTSRDELSPSVS